MQSCALSLHTRVLACARSIVGRTLTHCPGLSGRTLPSKPRGCVSVCPVSILHRICVFHICLSPWGPPSPCAHTCPQSPQPSLSNVAFLSCPLCCPRRVLAFVCHCPAVLASRGGEGKGCSCPWASGWGSSDGCRNHTDWRLWTWR